MIGLVAFNSHAVLVCDQHHTGMIHGRPMRVPID
jgi:hypothetical protein